jgi:hypothetical protein
MGNVPQPKSKEEKAEFPGGILLKIGRAVFEVESGVQSLVGGGNATVGKFDMVNLDWVELNYLPI